MKALRALMLVLALSVCSYAGDIPTCLTDNMPPAASADMDNDVAGNMPTVVADPITEITVNLLQSALSLL